jgi:hypothetical protein
MVSGVASLNVVACRGSVKAILSGLAKDIVGAFLREYVVAPTVSLDVVVPIGSVDFVRVIRSIAFATTWAVDRGRNRK